MHFTAPFVAALAALGATVEAARYTCDKANYVAVSHQILNPVYFCKFYLKAKRTNSPLKQFNAKQMTNLCHCFVQNAPRVAGPYKPLHPKPVAAGCPSSYYRSLRNQYKDVPNFCRFYLNDRRVLSPLPTMPNPNAVKAACRCFLDKKYPQQQPSSASTPEPTPEITTTTTTTTTTPAATTTTSVVRSSTTGGFSVGPVSFTTSSSLASSTTSVSASASSTGSNLLSSLLNQPSASATSSQSASASRSTSTSVSSSASSSSTVSASASSITASASVTSQSASSASSSSSSASSTA